jgi:hypothetical protein
MSVTEDSVNLRYNATASFVWMCVCVCVRAHARYFHACYINIFHQYQVY